MANITFEQVAGIPSSRENRATKLSDGNIYMVADNAGINYVKFAKSTDKGNSWESLPNIASANPGTVIFNPFLFEDENNILHFVYSIRPADFNISKKHSIWYKRANSLDFNWSEPVKIYECGKDDGLVINNALTSGCYEPCVVSVGDNKVAILFANESKLYTTLTQSIDAIICNTSIDPSEPGAFSDAFTVSCCWGYRDGMPIARNINNQIVCIIEDNSGYNGFTNFLATFLFMDSSFNKIITRNDPRRRMIEPLDDTLTYGGQPYFDTNSRGETIVICGGGPTGLFKVYYSKANYEDFELIRTFSHPDSKVAYGEFVQFINDDEFLIGYSVMQQGTSSWDAPVYRGVIDNNNNI